MCLNPLCYNFKLGSFSSKMGSSTSNGPLHNPYILVYPEFKHQRHRNIFTHIQILYAFMKILILKLQHPGSRSLGIPSRTSPNWKNPGRSIKPYAEYVTTLNDFGKKGGEYGLKVRGVPPPSGVFISPALLIKGNLKVT